MAHFAITFDDLVGTSRGTDFVTARQIAYYFERIVVGRSFPDIGRLYRRDHSTVIAGVNHMNERLKAKDPRYIGHVRALEPRIDQDARSTMVAEQRAPASFHCPTCGAPVIAELMKQIIDLQSKVNQLQQGAANGSNSRNTDGGVAHLEPQEAA